MKNKVSWRNSTGEVYFSRRHLRRKAENSKDNNTEPCVVCASPNVVQLFFLPADLPLGMLRERKKQFVNNDMLPKNTSW